MNMIRVKYHTHNLFFNSHSYESESVVQVEKLSYLLCKIGLRNNRCISLSAYGNINIQLSECTPSPFIMVYKRFIMNAF